MLCAPNRMYGRLTLGQWSWLLAALAAAAWLAATPRTALAQAVTLGGASCGEALSAPILNEWQGMGGQGGRLGCPTGAETVTSTSPQGSAARQATFDKGTILWHTSGPRAGQAYAVIACYRLYFQFGGPSGWLGLPISDAFNTPDGQRQSFEGGVLTYQRAPDECEATHAGEGAAPAWAPGVVERTPLDLFREPVGGDYATAASQSAATRLAAAHYERVRTEAYVLAEPAPGAAPLKLFWSETLGAHQSVATAQGERDALAAGYTFDGLQGYVWAGPTPGAQPLKQFRNAATGRSLLVATPQGEADAASAGFTFVRIEGYAATQP